MAAGGLERCPVKLSPRTLWRGGHPQVRPLLPDMMEEDEEEKYRESSWFLTLGFPPCQEGNLQSFVRLRLPWFSKSVWKPIGCNSQSVIGTGVKRDGKKLLWLLIHSP